VQVKPRTRRKALAGCNPILDLLELSGSGYKIYTSLVRYVLLDDWE